MSQAREREKPPQAQEEQERRGFRDRLVRWGGGTRESEAAVAAGLHWLIQHQAEDGRWSMHDFHTHGKCSCGDRGGLKNDIAGTALALLPLLGAGITPKSQGPDAAYARPVARGLQFLLAQQGQNGNFGSEMYSNALATLAVCQAYGLTGDAALKPSAQKAIYYIVDAQHTRGGWRYAPGQLGDTSVTGWQIQALRMAQITGLQVPPKTLAAAATFLSSCQTEDGTYGYVAPQASPTMTAVGVLSRELLGTSLRDPNLLAGVGHLTKWAPGSRNNLYHDYHAAHALFLTGGKEWAEWNARGRDLFIGRQDKGDQAGFEHQKGSWSPAGDLYAGMGRMLSTSLALLTLEVYYRTDLLLERQAPRQLGARELEALWAGLAGDDALQARQSVLALLRSPDQSLPFLGARLRPVPPPLPADSQRIQAALRDLDSEEFEVRQRATRLFEQCSEQEVGLLRKALQGGPAPEVRQRLVRILEKHTAAAAEERLRLGRALVVLEHAGTPESRRLLERLAGGAAGAWLTEEARAALQRQAKGPADGR
jgi:hypothetical protein